MVAVAVVTLVDVSEDPIPVVVVIATTAATPVAVVVVTTHVVAASVQFTAIVVADFPGAPGIVPVTVVVTGGTVVIVFTVAHGLLLAGFLYLGGYATLSFPFAGSKGELAILSLLLKLKLSLLCFTEERINFIRQFPLQ